MGNFVELRFSWQGFALTDALSALVGLPVYLINDARSYTLAEARLGAGRSTANLLGVTLGTGVGGGLVLDGRLRFGPNHMAGEFGHISTDPHGLRCGCGGLGCIESYASGPAIAAMALRLLLQGRAPMLRELIGGDLNKLDADAVAGAARQGEAECREIFERVGHAVGLGIAHVMKIADIERVIVGGGVAEAGEILFGPIRETVRANTAVFGAIQPQIAAASIEQAGSTGAALWARERHLEAMKTWRIAGINFDHMHMGDLLRLAHDHPGAEIVALCDADPARMQTARQNFAIADSAIYTDIDRCITESRPDLVILCPATAHHADFVEQVARHDVAILVERPFAASLAEADRMIAATRDGLLVINWPLAWYPPHITTKRLIDEGAIGEVIEVHYYDGNRGPLYHRGDKLEVEQDAALAEKAGS